MSAAFELAHTCVVNEENDGDNDDNDDDDDDNEDDADGVRDVENACNLAVDTTVASTTNSSSLWLSSLSAGCCIRTFAKSAHLVAILVAMATHYADLALDIFLTHSYLAQQSEGQPPTTNDVAIGSNDHTDEGRISAAALLTVTFQLLPSALLFLFAFVYELFNRHSTPVDRFKRIALMLTLCSTQLHMFVACFLLVGLFFAKDAAANNSEQAHMRQDISYCVLVLNLFHVVFGSYPQSIAQSVYFVQWWSSDWLSEVGTRSAPSVLNQLQLLKILVSLVRISWTSASFVSFFIQHEFAADIKSSSNNKSNNDNNNNECRLSRSNTDTTLFRQHSVKIFKWTRFVSNMLLFVSKAVPLVFLFNCSFQLGLVYWLVIKLCCNLLYAFRYLTNSSRELDKLLPLSYRLSIYNSLRLFWTLVLSLVRMVAHFEDFLQLKSARFFVYKLCDALEIVLVFVILIVLGQFKLECDNSAIPVIELCYFFAIALSCFLIANFVEAVYWLRVFDRDDFTSIGGRGSPTNNSFIVFYFKWWLTQRSCRDDNCLSTKANQQVQ